MAQEAAGEKGATALAGVRVLELTQFEAGLLAAQPDADQRVLDRARGPRVSIVAIAKGAG